MKMCHSQRRSEILDGIDDTNSEGVLNSDE